MSDFRRFADRPMRIHGTLPMQTDAIARYPYAECDDIGSELIESLQKNASSCVTSEH